MLVHFTKGLHSFILLEFAAFALSVPTSTMILRCRYIHPHLSGDDSRRLGYFGERSSELPQSYSSNNRGLSRPMCICIVFFLSVDCHFRLPRCGGTVDPGLICPFDGLLRRDESTKE